jgi:DNA repair exonuclease SbcCD ATPase subunit
VGDAACEHQGEHPRLRAEIEALEGRVERLEEWKDGREEKRVEDIREFSAQLGQVHEKVNGAVGQLAQIRGQLLLLPLVGSVGGGLLLFLAQRLFDHVAK